MKSITDSSVFAAIEPSSIRFVQEDRQGVLLLRSFEAFTQGEKMLKREEIFATIQDYGTTEQARVFLCFPSKELIRMSGNEVGLHA